ncbi:unnamed protein product [Boreogadus saida]
MPLFHCRVRNGSDRKGVWSHFGYRNGAVTRMGPDRVRQSPGHAHFWRWKRDPTAPLRSDPFRTLQWKRATRAMEKRQFDFKEELTWTAI